MRKSNFRIIYQCNLSIPSGALSLINNDLYSTGYPNFFEFFAKLVLFSPLSQGDKVRCFFLLLNKLDHNNHGSNVKQTHVCFLIWYLLRSSLVYTPYSEVCDKIENIKHSGRGGILFATIVDNNSKERFDVTELMNCWLTASRKYCCNSVIELGSGGKFQVLEQALKFWHKETGKYPSSLSTNNSLIINYRNFQSKRIIKYDFDNSFNIIHHGGGIRTQKKHVIAVQDSDFLYNYSSFCDVDNLLIIRYSPNISS